MWLVIGIALNVTSKLRVVPHKYPTISHLMAKRFETTPERGIKFKNRDFHLEHRSEKCSLIQTFREKKIVKITNWRKNYAKKNIQNKEKKLQTILREKYSKQQQSEEKLKNRLLCESRTTMKTKLILVGFLLHLFGCYNDVNCLSSLGSGSLRNTKQINKAVVSCFSYSLKYWDLEFWTSLKNLPFSILVHPK